jgi:hypothetical protein
MAAKIINQRNLPKNSEVAFAAVDVNAKRVIAEHFNISYVPHMRVFTKGDTQGYRHDSFLGAYDEGQRIVYGLVKLPSLRFINPLKIGWGVSGDLVPDKQPARFWFQDAGCGVWCGCF